MFGARRRDLAPIRHLRPADAGVCASRSGGGASDSNTLPETVRNGARLRRSSLDKVYRDNPPLACSVYLDELQVCVRMRMRVGVCGYACVCARA